MEEKMTRIKPLRIVLGALIALVFQFSIYAQTTGSISGTVADSNGAVVPNASVTVKGAAGQEFTVTTNESGIYRIPAVSAGFYTVTVTAKDFKKSVISNVKVDVGIPITVNATLEVGDINQIVEVTSGGEVLQTQTATVGTNIQGRQIIETPIQSRDALDLVVNLPGTNTIGSVRTSTINGLPKSAISTSIDGIDANTSLLKSSDGFFTYIRPRIDAIDEVTVSTSNPGADTGGDSAVQIKFVTRRGTNDYSGGLYWQHRNEALNANYWLNNRDGLARQKIKLNQYGGRVGGPIPLPNFGEGGPMFTSGKDRAFFFVNYEEYRIPEASPTRTRTILDTGAQAGQFQYVTGGVTNTVDILALAGSKGFTGTPDPTISALLNRIRQSTTLAGTVTPISGDVNRERLNFTNFSSQVRKFVTSRVDFNLTKNHSLETVVSYNRFRGTFDLLNSVDPVFPGFENGGAQNSDRWMATSALRSTFGQNIVNEFRFGRLWGESRFDLIGGTEFFANNQKGFNLNLNVTNLGSLSTATARNSGQARQEPTNDFTDNVTLIQGNHTINFGGQYKVIELLDNTINRFVPTVGFAVASTDPILSQVFTAANFPGASAAQLAEAAALYALLTGRVSSYTSEAYLGADGKYVAAGPLFRQIKQRTYGLYAQDSWKINPNLTLTFGVRWQPQEGYTLVSKNFSRLSDFNMIYDVSGRGNIFSPGTLTGVVPTVVGNESGEKSYQTDFHNYAPSVGLVWSPDFNENDFLKTIFGSSGKSVFRGGFSRAFIREGTNLAGNVIGSNPGGSISASRASSLGNLTALGTLLRDANNPNLTPPAFDAAPVYPRPITSADSEFAFDPNLKTGYVDSWSVGYQRELDKNTVVEVRYVGNRGKDMFRLYSLNETNTIENGFAAEFLKAQNNFYLNQAAGKGNTFAYFADVPGSSPLPIFQSYYTGNANSASYTSTQYTNSGNINALSKNNPNVIGLAASLETDATRRANRAASGRAVNFINNCPTTIGFCFLLDNSERSWYDSVAVEVRRRMSNGLRLQASYVYAKAFTNSFAGAINTGGFAAFSGGGADQSNGSSVTLRNPSLDKSFAQIDLRHAFKLDATYDLPFGRGAQFFSNDNWFTNSVLGGWSIIPTLRWQSGSPFSLENVQLIGMTVKELQKEIKVRKGATVVTYLPDDIINNTIAAFNTDITRANGYSAQFGVPTGRFIAPAGYGNCQARFPGDCGFRRLTLYGPDFFKIDASLAKKIQFDEKRNVELRATFFDVLNRTNWRVGGWTGNFTNVTNMNLSTFGQLGSGTAYQDPFGSNDPGGRIIDLTLRINF
jgi:hypothetical protein